MEIKEPSSTHHIFSLLHSITDKLMGWYDCSYDTKYGKFKSYGAVRAKGDFNGTFDYGRGLLYVSIRSSPTCVSVASPITYETHLHIGNIDDGSWDAYSKMFPTPEECNDLTEKVYQAFLNAEDNHYLRLPTEETLNEMLRPLGMWGQSEG